MTRRVRRRIYTHMKAMIRTAAQAAYLAKSFALIADESDASAAKLEALAAKNDGLTGHWAECAAAARAKATEYRARAAALTA